jgi:hypothetical protein
MLVSVPQTLGSELFTSTITVPTNIGLSKVVDKIKEPTIRQIMLPEIIVRSKADYQHQPGLQKTHQRVQDMINQNGGQ